MEEITYVGLSILVVLACMVYRVDNTRFIILRDMVFGCERHCLMFFCIFVLIFIPSHKITSHNVELV